MSHIYAINHADAVISDNGVADIHIAPRKTGTYLVEEIDTTKDPEIDYEDGDNEGGVVATGQLTYSLAVSGAREMEIAYRVFEATGEVDSQRIPARIHANRDQPLETTVKLVNKRMFSREIRQLHQE